MAMDKEWEKFHGGPTAPRETRLRAAISPQGAIEINKNLFRVIGKPDAVYIYFNRTRKQIALESTSPRFAEAFPVKQCQNGYLLHAAPFLRHHGIKITERLRFVRPNLGPDGQLILDLTQTVSVAGTKRNKKKPVPLPTKP